MRDVAGSKVPWARENAAELVRLLGLRLLVAACAVAGVVVALSAAQSPPVRLLGLGLGVVFATVLVIVLVGDLRGPPSEGPARAGGLRWAAGSAFAAGGGTMLAAGLLDAQRGGGGELLLVGALGAIVFGWPLGHTIHLWWHGGRRRSHH